LPFPRSCMAFWTTRVYSLSELTLGMYLVFSGQFVPLQLMPGLVQTIALYMPFQLFIYFPIQLVLGNLSRVEIYRGFLMAGIWLVVMSIVFFWIWREGVKRFSAVGA
jgi:ABC-2 type transport system permease protein